MNKLLKTILALFSWISVSSNLDAGQIIVREINPYTRNGNLCSEIGCGNLFSEKIIGTIQSGLPSIIDVKIKLAEASDKTIATKSTTIEITHNIWTETYTIKRDNRTETVPNFQIVKKKCSSLEIDSIIALTHLRQTEQYVIFVKIEINPISSKQSEKIQDWIMDSTPTEVEVTSTNRTNVISFNLSKLIKFFFGEKKASENSSKWTVSNVFKMNELQHAAHPK